MVDWQYHDNALAPLANWPLDEYVGGEYEDISGNALPLTVESGTQRDADLVPGFAGTWLDGSTVLVENTGDASLRLLGDWSIAFFVMPTAYPGAAVGAEMATHGVPNAETAESDNFAYQTKLTQTAARVAATWETTGQVDVDVTTIAALVSHIGGHVALVKRGLDFEVYLDTVLVATATASGQPVGGGSGKFRFGGGTTGAGLAAVVASLVVFGEAITPSELFGPAPPATFDLLLAVPISSREIRAYFSGRPRAISDIAGAIDSLDRRSWSWSGGVVVRAGGARAEPDFDPTNYPDAWSVVVEVDRKIDHRTEYTLSASTESWAGAALTTSTATHGGIADRAAPRAVRARRATEAADLAKSAGALVASPSGDLASHSGVSTLRKRVLRRIETALAGHYHLPLYGAGLVPKRKASIAKIRADVVTQLAQERDLELGSVDFAVVAPGIARVRVVGRLKTGERLDVTETLGSGSVPGNG